MGVHGSIMAKQIGEIGDNTSSLRGLPHMVLQSTQHTCAQSAGKKGTTCKGERKELGMGGTGNFNRGT